MISRDGGVVGAGEHDPRLVGRAEPREQLGLDREPALDGSRSPWTSSVGASICDGREAVELVLVAPVRVDRIGPQRGPHERVTSRASTASCVMKSDTAASAVFLRRGGWRGRLGRAHPGVGVEAEAEQDDAGELLRLTAAPAWRRPSSRARARTGRSADARCRPTLLDPGDDGVHVGDGAVRRQPSGRVARRRAIAAQVDRVDVEPGVRRAHP